MRKVTLFIAMSLDGYIADRDGKVDWLVGQEAGKDDMISYQTFIREIDTVIMGWNTYHQIATELSPGNWYYKELMSYVFTHKKMASTENIKFVNQDVCTVIKELQQTEGKGIWICGGATIVQQAIQANLIDRYHISIIPTILGDGIRLFGPSTHKESLRLIETYHYNGITDLLYEKNE